MYLPATQQRFIGSVQSALQKYDAELKAINNKIWSTPELGYAEHQAHDNICALFDALTPHGYKVTRSAWGLETAFEITFTNNSDPTPNKSNRTIVFNAEYDALPGIGHACGHNLIATSSIAAFLATCEALTSQFPNANATTPTYTIRLLGTPAEESYGGKVHLLQNGAYKDVSACLMVHPISMAPGHPNLLSMATVLPGGFLANDKFRVTFTGKPAHAAAAPWEGVNALDAVVAAYVNISLLRQQIRPEQRIHGVIVNGGDRPNVIPGEATVEYYVRARTRAELRALTQRVVRCFEAAGDATGCGVDIQWGISYDDLKTNTPLCESYVSVMRAMGHHTLLNNAGQASELTGASTDMGNVSYAVPGFHGLFTIPTEGVNHTPLFTKGAGSSEAHERSLACAAGMAVVACQMVVDDEFASKVRGDFEGGSRWILGIVSCRWVSR
ncbi:metal-dependent amidase/aminoacylase/carboxypeptidase [Aspergillus heteromorphus CBS 117.55]|uniref:Peptidase M20 domain-containing protein 2 n=1 Tax=Aspergillus heteromorphus CBS 117.55 TaxID=1448321 RepID=A0A317VGZ6_9EURO|nr:metal-dependent amidase/aminoacylase/carboxypeptidase [Aspergillus heteromorphus CBS 117.55]PWY72298.1 metal-dependent amidase/aminoacylase/carboxypeptidase [Aspergillus heteromorphus CBS 117.55]